VAKKSKPLKALEMQHQMAGAADGGDVETDMNGTLFRRF
jgi:hypothetical protein